MESTLPPRVFCDTSFFYACLDASDSNHEKAGNLIERAVASATAFHCTWDIISETVTLLRYRNSYASAMAFLKEVKPALQILDYGDGVRSEAEKVFELYGRDHRLSFCDAVSFVVVSTLLEHMPCLSFDRDFKELGLTVLT
jgi:predicted nucleic acid-binding protein